MKRKRKRKANYSEIRMWYKFRPQCDIWISKSKGDSCLYVLKDETWYDGYWFNTGIFSFIQFKYFAIHIMFKLWKIKL